MTGNDLNYLMYYGTIDEAALHRNDGNKGWWSALEKDTVDGKLVFEINPSSDLSIKNEIILEYKPPASKYFSLVTIKENSSNWNKQIALFHSVREVANLWIDVFPQEMANQ